MIATRGPQCPRKICCQFAGGGPAYWLSLMFRGTSIPKNILTGLLSSHKEEGVSIIRVR